MNLHGHAAMALVAFCRMSVSLATSSFVHGIQVYGACFWGLFSYEVVTLRHSFSPASTAPCLHGVGHSRMDGALLREICTRGPSRAHKQMLGMRSTFKKLEHPDTDWGSSRVLRAGAKARMPAQPNFNMS